jgi:DNA polymerase-3 subunit chi
MTSVDFYYNANDRLQVACRLAGKALQQRKRVLIYAPQGEVAARVDRMLWTWPATGFVPHCMAGDPLAAETPVLIARDAYEAAPCEILLNLGDEAPPFYERFERLLEIVGREDAERSAGRARYRRYREAGHAISDHDLAKESGRDE